MRCFVLTELDSAYIAGLLDADGSVRIHKQFTSGGASRYTLDVRIANTDTKLIEYLINTVGGGVREHVQASRRLVCYSWTICAVAALEFLQQVLPYMRTKKAEAEIGIRFQKQRGTVGQHRTYEEKEMDETLYLRCKELKKERGIRVPVGGASS